MKTVSPGRITLLASIACQVGDGDEASTPTTHDQALAALTAELGSAAFSRFLASSAMIRRPMDSLKPLASMKA